MKTNRSPATAHIAVPVLYERHFPSYTVRVDRGVKLPPDVMGTEVESVVVVKRPMSLPYATPQQLARLLARQVLSEQERAEVEAIIRRELS